MPKPPFSPSIPAELHIPPPRRVSRRKGTIGGLIAVRLFLLPHTLIGLGALFYAVEDPLFIVFTPTIPATVTDLTSHTSRKGGTTYRVIFRYSADRSRYPGRDFRTDEADLSKAEYETLHRYDMIAIHSGVIGTHRQTVLARSFGGYIANRYPMWLWTLFWNGVVSAFLYRLWIVPYRAKSLVRNGQPVLGKITKKRKVIGKSTTYHLDYEFTPVGSRHTQMASDMITTSRQYDSATEGQITTIIYDTLAPSRSVAYEFGDFQAKSEWRVPGA